MLKPESGLGRALKKPFSEVGNSVTECRDNLTSDAGGQEVMQHYQKMTALKRYCYALVPRPCVCDFCKASVAHREVFVSEVGSAMKGEDEHLNSALGKFIESCERKSATHSLQEEDMFYDALLSLNYISWLRPVENAQLRCVCDLMWLIRRTNATLWIARIRNLAAVVDVIEAWDQLPPDDKTDKGGYALVDVLKQYPILCHGMQYGTDMLKGYHIVSYFLKPGSDAGSHLHTCAYKGCPKLEWLPGEYRVCSLCKSKKCGVLHFYCSEECQKVDWDKSHRKFHELLSHL